MSAPSRVCSPGVGYVASMSARSWLLVTWLLVGCGADEALPAPPDAIACVRGSLPDDDGPLASPAALPPLTGCVAGGLDEDGGGVYLVRGEPLADGFNYKYARVAHACALGVEVDGYEDTWTDGTTAFARSLFRGTDFVYVRAAAYCRRTDDTLAWVEDACFEDAEGVACFGTLTGTGVAYQPHDGAARNVAVVGQDVAENVAFDVDIKGTVAYVALNEELRAYDLSDPAALTLLGSLPLPDVAYINDIEVLVDGAERFAYLGAEAALIVNVTDPTAMVALGAVDISGRDAFAHTVQIGDRGGTPVLYLVGQETGVPVYDLSTPGTPTYLDRVPLAQEGTHDLTADGDRLWVNNAFAGLVALDTTSLAAPVELGRLGGSYYSHASAVGVAGGRAIALEGGEGLEADGTGTRLRVLDGDPASPTFMTVLGQYATRAETGIHNLALVGDLAFIAYYQDGLRVVDLADPTAPVEIAHFRTWDPATGSLGPFAGAIGVDVAADGTIVVVNYEGQVFRLRLTLPARAPV